MDILTKKLQTNHNSPEKSPRPKTKLAPGKPFKEIKNQITKKSLEELATFSGSKPTVKTSFHSDNVFEGSVENPEICLQFLHGRCSQDYCKYLHCPKTYHWQIFYHPKSLWLNLSNPDSKSIEQAFLDYKKEWVTFTHCSDGDNNTKEKFFRCLFGKQLVTATFKDMSLQCFREDFKDFQERYPIRRLSTPSDQVSSDPFATVWTWYFLFGETEWVSYGLQNSPITSEDIEKESNESSTFVLNFISSQYNHDINVLSLTDTNKQTGNTRPMRKRPAQSKTKAKNSQANKSHYPSTWSNMPKDEPHCLPTVEDKYELEKLESRFVESLERCPRKMTFLRLQNKYMWEKYIRRREVVAKLLEKDGSEVEQILYKSVKADHLQYILLHNLAFNSETHDKRNSAGVTFRASAKLCEKDQQSANKKKVIVQARVIVGAMTKLTQKMTQLPVNSNTMQLYDTAVDDVENPTLYVKFSEDDYYPEYVVKFK